MPADATTRARPAYPDPDALVSASIAADMHAATCRASINQLKTIKGAINTMPVGQLVPWLDAQIATVESILKGIS